MKHFFTLLTFCVLATASFGQIVITEINYNGPESGSDSTEFIELYNNSANPVDMTGYSFTQGVTYTFPSYTLAAGAYMIVAVDSAVMVDNFGVSSASCRQWTSGGLSNGGEDIALRNASAVQVDSVDYDDNNGWVTEPDGSGPSLELCSVDSNNVVPTVWFASTNATGIIANGNEYMFTPAAANSVSCSVVSAPTHELYTIDQIDGVDVNGVGDSLNVLVELHGIVHCIDFDDNAGYKVTLIDNSLEGIQIFDFNDYGSYTNPQEGDSLIVKGTIGQFNGLLQIAPDSIGLVSTGNATFPVNTVTVLDETTESKVVKIENVDFVTPTATWAQGNVDVTDGNNTFTLRIENATGMVGTPTPTGSFNVTGVGGQFDNSSPYTSGYQLFPCGASSIEGTVIPPSYTLYPIDDIDGVDSNGEPDSSGVLVEIHGTVHCVDFDDNAGYKLTVIDNSLEGIQVFSFTDFGSYTTPAEGDSIVAQGTVGHFNGLSQVSADTVYLAVSGQTTQTPTIVTTLDETTENQMITMENMSLVTPTTTWAQGNVDITDGTNTFTMRIEDASGLVGQNAPTTTFSVTGVGGQFDTSSPYTEGYQVLPCSVSSIVEDTIDTSGLDELTLNAVVYPNPVNDVLNVHVNVPGAVNAMITDISGKIIFNETISNGTVSTTTWTSGVYFVELTVGNLTKTVKVLK